MVNLVEYRIVIIALYFAASGRDKMRCNRLFLNDSKFLLHDYYCCGWVGGGGGVVSFTMVFPSNAVLRVNALFLTAAHQFSPHGLSVT